MSPTHSSRMPLFLLIVNLMCGLAPGLRSTSINKGVTSGLSRGTAVDDEKLLACVVTNDKIIIQAEDRPFWDYFYTKESFYNSGNGTTQSINCQAHTPPLKSSFALRNLSNPYLGEDVIGVIASFDNPVVRCMPCRVLEFNPDFLEKCNSPSIRGPSQEEVRQEFSNVHTEVQEEGGFCRAAWASVEYGKTLQSCMQLGSLWAQIVAVYFKVSRGFAACDMPEIH